MNYDEECMVLRKLGYKYLVRDKDKSVWAHQTYPYKLRNCWVSSGGICPFYNEADCQWDDDSPTFI